MAVPPRDLAPLLRWFRNALLGRDYKTALRFQDKLATRSPPPPKLPDGPSHKLFDNYYFTRDGRRQAHPPLILIEGTKRKAITAGIKENVEAKSVTSQKIGAITPGTPYVWPEPSSQ
ncbi:NADH dehydrogenase [ubiquinone] 1 alpha subcomplex subunit 7, partial [Stegodyphus mimosarum]